MVNFTYMTLRENVVQAIREKILRNELTPGMHIIEQNLSKEFGVSRGPIREALRQLEEEGVVEYTRNAGCTVTDTSIQDVYELYVIRSSYEMLSVRTSAVDFSEEEIEAMKGILAQMEDPSHLNIQRIEDLDYEFHKKIVEHSGMKHLMRAWEKTSGSIFLCMRKAKDSDEKLKGIQGSLHRDILDAIVEGDREKICSRIYWHYMKPIRRMEQENGAEEAVYYLPEL